MQEDISQNLDETSLNPWLWESDRYPNNCCWGSTDLWAWFKVENEPSDDAIILSQLW